MRTIRVALAAIGALLFLAFGDAKAQAVDGCEFIEGSGAALEQPYDVFDGAAAAQGFSIRFRNSTATDFVCRVVYMTPNGLGEMTSPLSMDILRFEIQRNNGSNLLIRDDDANLRPAQRRNMPAGTRRRVNPNFVVAPEQFVAPGSYSAIVTAGVYDDADPNRTILSTRELTFTANVNAQGAIYVSLVGDATTNSGSSATLDLGEITEDEAAATINFLVQSNGDYRFRVTSDNNGRLQLINPPSVTNGFDDFVAYEIRSGGALVALDGSDFPAGPALDATTIAGQRRIFELQTESGPNQRDGNFVEGKLSGRYEDVVTFSIVPE